MTKKLNIDNLCFGIAITLKEEFNIDGDDLPKYVFLVHNLVCYPVKLIPKKYSIKGKGKTKIVRKNGMNIDNLKTIGNILLNKNKEYALQQNKFHKINSIDDDIWIELKKFEDKYLSSNPDIVDLKRQYKK